MKKRNTLLFISMLFIAFGIGYNYYTSGTKETKTTINYTDFINKIKQKEITRVSINGNTYKVEGKDKKQYIVVVPLTNDSLLTLMQDNNVNISVPSPDSESGSMGIYVIFACILLFFLFRSLRKDGNDQGGQGRGPGGGNNPFGFGKSKARMVSPKDTKSRITFNDVAGVDEAKEDLKEVVDFLKDPKKFEKLGAKIPKGCLLVGSPGTGKTLLARAVAGEAEVPFFSISGSDFVEMFVGVGASRVRDLFTQAKKSAPCIVFIDEIDAVGRQRGVGVGGGNDEREQTLNQLLVEMDGFSPNQGIIILAATNRADVLDSALLRPGRFDRQVTVPLPDITGRERILQIYLSKVPLSQDVDKSIIARGTTGFSGADIANLVNEAALSAARKDKQFVEMEDFEEARDKILMGSERKTAKMSEDERKLTAYHEAGHALVAFKVEGSYPVHKVTIIPRGKSLGVTAFLPERDEYSRSYKQLIAQLAVLFGGRLAEELIFGKENITTGASMDIKMATNLARKMIIDWGFSDKVGRIKYSEDQPTYGGKAISEDTARDIEIEVKQLIMNAENTARTILTTYSVAHQDLSLALLEYETLTGAEAKKISNGETIAEIRNLLATNKLEQSQQNASVPLFDEVK